MQEEKEIRCYNVGVEDLYIVDTTLGVKQTLYIMAKYGAYLEKQSKDIELFQKSNALKIPEDFDFKGLKGLRLEAAQKLDAFRPATLGQASRISGVSPADIGVLSVFVKAAARQKGESSGE